MRQKYTRARIRPLSPRVRGESGERGSMARSISKQTNFVLHSKIRNPLKRGLPAGVG